MNQNSDHSISFNAIPVPISETREILKSNMDLIQNNILRILNLKNISQSDLARAIESDPQHISRILRKTNRGITIKVLGRISKALNTPMSELVQ